MGKILVVSDNKNGFTFRGLCNEMKKAEFDYNDYLDSISTENIEKSEYKDIRLISLCPFSKEQVTEFENSYHDRTFRNDAEGYTSDMYRIPVILYMYNALISGVREDCVHSQIEMKATESFEDIIKYIAGLALIAIIVFLIIFKFKDII